MLEKSSKVAAVSFPPSFFLGRKHCKTSASISITFPLYLASAAAGLALYSAPISFGVMRKSGSTSTKFRAGATGCAGGVGVVGGPAGEVVGATEVGAGDPAGSAAALAGGAPGAAGV